MNLPYFIQSGLPNLSDFQLYDAKTWAPATLWRVYQIRSRFFFSCRTGQIRRCPHCRAQYDCGILLYLYLAAPEAPAVVYSFSLPPPPLASLTLWPLGEIDREREVVLVLYCTVLHRTAHIPLSLVTTIRHRCFI